MENKATIGLAGLAVMGSNLVRNIESRGYKCAIYNRTKAVTDSFMSEFGDGNFISAHTLKEFVDSIATPRIIILMVKAGRPVDDLIDGLLPFLNPGDVLMDGGNTYFTDTARRVTLCKEKGVYFVGCGISGGEEGALKGPSLMPGGPEAGCRIVAPVLEKIAAVGDGPCTTYIGPDGAGHFVKMVHNGIEYGDMQIIAEAYDVLRNILNIPTTEIADIFDKWNSGPLSSYLIEITAKILRKVDDDGLPLVDKILDKAGQKGTGAWTVQIAAELGVAIPTISAALDARILSSLKSERIDAANIFPEKVKINEKALLVEEVINWTHDALLLF